MRRCRFMSALDLRTRRVHWKPRFEASYLQKRHSHTTYSYKGGGVWDASLPGEKSNPVPVSPGPSRWDTNQLTAHIE